MKRLLLLALLIAAPALAQDRKISELPDGSPGQATDAIPIARAGANYRLPFSAFAFPGTLTGPLSLNMVDPPGTLTASVYAVAGNLTGTYYYRVTFVNAVGETNSGVNGYSVAVNPAAQQVSLTGIPASTDSSVTARRIYRTAGTGGYFTDNRLVATISDNVTQTLTDNVADGARGVYMPWNNTTGGMIYQNGLVMAAATETYTVFGWNALQNSFGYDNIAIGSAAMEHNTYGHDNIAMGADSLKANTVGNYNVALGESALITNISGSSNVAVGDNTIRANTSGNNNTGIGDNALNKNQTGANNVAVGQDALYNNIGGGSNNALGNQALQNATSADFNTAVGHTALNATTTGGSNTAIGRAALVSNQTGTNNVAVGTYAGAYETGSNAFYVDNRNRTNTAGDKANALIYGIFGAAPKDQRFTINAFAALAPIAFADLGAPANGTFAYCSDCLVQAACAGSGAGALAKRLNGAWVCN